MGEDHDISENDHRVIGKKLDLFHIDGENRGMVFWHPNGHSIWRSVEQYVRRRLELSDYKEVRSPQLMNKHFWQASGHWDKYKPNMYVCDSDEGDESLALKPMNCPAHVQIFNSSQRSYRDLPMRMSEFGCCHRKEPSGSLLGLFRVASFVQDDAHIFCREDQVVGEIAEFIRLVRSVHADFGFKVKEVRLATRPENRSGSDEFWDKAEADLAQAAKDAGIVAVIAEGDGAFYAPKLDFVVEDSMGREWVCGTVQLDYVLPKRLGAFYIGEDDQKHHPVMVHRAILGSFERFIGILLENYAGSLPVWLSPVQVVVANISSYSEEYSRYVVDQFKKAGVRVEVDLRSERIDAKVRDAAMKKVPYIVVLGKKELDQRSVSIRGRDGKSQVMKLDDAVKYLVDESKSPVY